MSTIAIDIDDTLYSFQQAAREAFLEVAEDWGEPAVRNGAYHPWTEWRSMMDSAGPGAGEEVIRRVHHPKAIKTQRPFKNANTVVYALARAGHELLYISNRDADTHDATQEWLDFWGFPPGELVCTREDKIPLLRGCQYIIDDRPKTLVQFVYDRNWPYPTGKRRLGFALASPVNQNLTDIPGVYLSPTWSGIAHYLRKKEVL
jgi:hypothetical protein